MRGGFWVCLSTRTTHTTPTTHTTQQKHETIASFKYSQFLNDNRTFKLGLPSNEEDFKWGREVLIWSFLCPKTFLYRTSVLIATKPILSLSIRCLVLQTVQGTVNRLGYCIKSTKPGVLMDIQALDTTLWSRTWKSTTRSSESTDMERKLISKQRSSRMSTRPSSFCWRSTFLR